MFGCCQVLGAHLALLSGEEWPLWGKGKNPSAPSRDEGLVSLYCLLLRSVTAGLDTSLASSPCGDLKQSSRSAHVSVQHHAFISCSDSYAVW